MLEPIDQRVRDRVRELGDDQESLFTPEMLEALRLAEMFESIKPDEYVLPLDALAGFHASASGPPEKKG